MTLTLGSHVLPEEILAYSCGKPKVLVLRFRENAAYVVGADSRNKAETIAAVGPNFVLPISASKHFMMLDNPAEFYEAIARLIGNNF